MSRYTELLDEIQAVEEEIEDRTDALTDSNRRLEALHEELYDTPIDWTC